MYRGIGRSRHSSKLVDREVREGLAQPGSPLVSPEVGRVREPQTTTEGGEMEAAQETGQITGTKDKDYNIIWFVEQCLSNVLRLETYIQDAERDGDSDLADFFRRAQGESRKGAEQGKELLRSRIAS
jgi:hypothetical protein